MLSIVKKTITFPFAALALMLLMTTLFPSSYAVASFQSAKSLFASKCAVCHGNDGGGGTAKGKELKVRDWRSAPEVKKMSDAQLLEITLKGKGKMEAYEKNLGKEKVQMLVAYSRELINKQ
jgi:mono/diheme cytochrome c family protein